jgi:hypothetical protein
MNPTDILRALRQDQESRISQGTGKINSRTIDIGDTAIAIDNIGSLRVIHTTKSPVTLIIGGIILAVALYALFFASGGVAVIVFAVIGGALIFWNLNQKVDVYLSIGTSDGRSTTIVSKDIAFLNEIRNFIRKKIDTKNTETATINISNSELIGNIAVGSSAEAISVKDS